MPNLDLSDLNRELERRAAELRDSTRLMQRVGVAGVEVLDEHFIARGGTFWPSFADPRVTHLDENSVSATGATILISPTENVPYGAIMWHKILGGPIIAKPPRKMVAVPTKTNPQPDKWPSMYEPGELVALWGAHGPYALCDARMLARAEKRREKIGRQIQKLSRMEARGQSKERRGQLFDSAKKEVRRYQGNAEKRDIEAAKLFILVRDQTKPQRKDEDALPSSDAFCSAVIERLDGVT